MTTTFSRRQFLAGTAAVAAGAAGTVAVTWSDLLVRSVESPFPRDTPILVVVTLDGGNDGLSTVIPYASEEYASARPQLAYARADVLELDGEFGLNPVLTGLRDRWDAGQVAIVRAAGYPDADRSHARAMDIWQSGSTEPNTTGWIGRWLDTTAEGPGAALTIGQLAPLLVRGRTCTGACLDLSGAATDLRRDLAGFADTDEPVPVAQEIVRAAYRNDVQVRRRLAGKAPLPVRGTDLGIRGQLSLVATAVRLGLPIRVYSVRHNGFDTHANQREQHEGALADLDSGLRTLLDAVRDFDVTVLVYSEFGRRVHENSSGGTDHGTAGPVFVLGRRVRGGFYGDAPSLTGLVDGDLRFTTDFRDVYATVLSKVLGSDPAEILGARRSSIPFL